MGEGRVSSGVAGLDGMIGGGFPAHRAVVVRGQAGTGKTTLATQFLMEGVRNGEPGLFVSVDCKPRHVMEDASRLGWDLQDAVSRKTLAVLDASPYFTATRKGAIDARQVATDLTHQVRTHKATRLVIDSLTSLLPPEDEPSAVRDFVRSLFFSLEDNLGCTVLVTAWPRDASSGAADYTDHAAAGVVELALVKAGAHFERRLFLRKMRGVPVELTERRFEIVADRGVVLDGRS
jgi:KaiC/GvpD/RAD55 family RecA-like ATPase